MEKTVSRKHFQAIAAAIRTGIASKAEREAVARALLPAMREANANFNAGKFLEACIGE